MKYLLDTDILVDHLRKKKFLDKDILEKGAAISIITLGELLYGVYKSDNPTKSYELLKYTLNILNLGMLNLNDEIMIEFGKIKAELEKDGKRLEDFDLLIASVALENNLTLLTRNMNHFKRIQGLKLA
ncbi:type II toxin-antitoxin system VapC family toxin [Candidatus Daviesbacteria bacterium]|nr:type II toxin-antitoxin system VapC family toxin [Candidatus Daviesbacteria bacterium]